MGGRFTPNPTNTPGAHGELAGDPKHPARPHREQRGHGDRHTALGAAGCFLLQKIKSQVIYGFSSQNLKLLPCRAISVISIR